MEMEKAYDTSVLLKELEKEGIVGGIGILKNGVVTFQAWLTKSAELSTEGLLGKLDDIAVKGEKFATDLIVSKLSELEAKLIADQPAPAEVPAAVEAPVAEAPVEEPAAPAEPEKPSA